MLLHQVGDHTDYQYCILLKVSRLLRYHQPNHQSRSVCEHHQNGLNKRMEKVGEPLTDLFVDQIFKSNMQPKLLCLTDNNLPLVLRFKSEHLRCEVMLKSYPAFASYL